MHHAKLCEVWPEVEVTNADASLESRSAGKKQLNRIFRAYVAKYIDLRVVE